MGWCSHVVASAFLVALLPLTASAQEYVPEEGSHQGAKMEMWNLHGHLVTPDGRALGLTTMFFTGKYLLVSGTAVGLGLIDEREKKSAFDYDFFLPLFGKVIHTPGQLDERYGPNRLQLVAPGTYALTVRTGGLAASLTIRATRRALPYAGSGLVRWGTHESRGYSFPRAEVSGTVGWKDVVYPVTGHVNLDHAWSSVMEEDHDLFMVQLADGTDANVLFRHDPKGNGPLPGSFITLSSPDGQRVSYDSYAIEIESRWKSPVTGRRYPNRVHVRLPDERIDWVLVPSFDEQEFTMMMNMMAFWAGTGTVLTAEGTQAAAGRYCGVLQGYGKE